MLTFTAYRQLTTTYRADTQIRPVRTVIRSIINRKIENYIKEKAYPFQIARSLLNYINHPTNAKLMCQYEIPLQNFTFSVKWEIVSDICGIHLYLLFQGHSWFGCFTNRDFSDVFLIGGLQYA